MNKDYQNAMLELVRFDAGDIIATSDNINVDDGDDIIDLPFVPAD